MRPPIVSAATLTSQGIFELFSSVCSYKATGTTETRPAANVKFQVLSAPSGNRRIRVVLSKVSRLPHMACVGLMNWEDFASQARAVYRMGRSTDFPHVPQALQWRCRFALCRGRLVGSLDKVPPIDG